MMIPGLAYEVESCRDYDRPHLHAKSGCDCHGLTQDTCYLQMEEMTSKLDSLPFVFQPVFQSTGSHIATHLGSRENKQETIDKLRIVIQEQKDLLGEIALLVGYCGLSSNPMDYIKAMSKLSEMTEHLVQEACYSQESRDKKRDEE